VAVAARSSKLASLVGPLELVGRVEVAVVAVVFAVEDKEDT